VVGDVGERLGGPALHLFQSTPPKTTKSWSYKQLVKLHRISIVICHSLF
jgi:hypothetical protein